MTRERSSTAGCPFSLGGRGPGRSAAGAAASGASAQTGGRRRAARRLAADRRAHPPGDRAVAAGRQPLHRARRAPRSDALHRGGAAVPAAAEPRGLRRAAGAPSGLGELPLRARAGCSGARPAARRGHNRRTLRRGPGTWHAGDGADAQLHHAPGHRDPGHRSHALHRPDPAGLSTSARGTPGHVEREPPALTAAGAAQRPIRRAPGRVRRAAGGVSTAVRLAPAGGHAAPRLLRPSG